MFDHVTKATRLENEIRDLWQQYAKLQNMRDAYRHNRDRYNESQMAKRMNILTLDMNHAIRLWEAETGKQWTIWHYHATDADPITIAAWDALGRSLNAQLDMDMQGMVDLWEVWRYLDTQGGELHRTDRGADIRLNVDDHSCVPFWYQENTMSIPSWLNVAAEWIRQQGAA